MDLTGKELTAFKKRIADSLELIWLTTYETDSNLFSIPKVDFSKDSFQWGIDNYVQSLNNKEKRHLFLDMFGNLGPTNLVANLINDFIRQINRNPKQRYNGPANDYFSDREKAELVEIISNTIKRYPREYHVLLELPRVIPLKKPIKLGTNEILITDAKHLASEYKLPNLSGLFGTITSALSDDPAPMDHWGEERAYILVKMMGYFARYEKNNFDVLCQDRFYSLLGLAMAIGLLDHDNLFWGLLGLKIPVSPTVSNLQIFETSDEKGPVYIGSIPIPIQIQKTINNLKFSDNPGSGLVALAKLASTQHSSPGYKEAGRKVLSASRWFFDSICEDNQTHGFVQAMVGLEILLGDYSPKPKLKETLGDRLAYLLAPSAAEREAIRSRFYDLYDKRSHIVHRGMPILPEKDFSDFWEVKDFLTRTITTETYKLVTTF